MHATQQRVFNCRGGGGVGGMKQTNQTRALTRGLTIETSSALPYRLLCL